MINVNIPPSNAGQLPTFSAAGTGYCNLPMPIFDKCSNITINFNLRNWPDNLWKKSVIVFVDWKHIFIFLGIFYLKKMNTLEK